jgi:L-aspartate oxidase
LLLHDGRVCGAWLIDDAGKHHEVRAAGVLLATGGLGNVYRNSTNPAVATGDGIGMAFRAGAELSDMEFVQFHPTALDVRGAPRFLLSEALRGEGAYLRNGNLERFMPKYHAMAELAPRDVVARAITHELEVSKAKDPTVYLDLTHLQGRKLDQRFPRIHATCLQYNVDISTDLIPVRPAAHYAMGGVRTDLDGRTNLPGLYAAGEAACTGVHGANRLASNSLLEGLVYGARAGAAMGAERTAAKSITAAVPEPSARGTGNGSGADPEEIVRRIQDLMWRHVGIVRDASGLRRSLAELQQMQALLAGHTRRCWEARNLHQTAWLIARSALAREESRGAHYRTDFPAHDDRKFLKHSVIQGERIRFE